MSNSNNIQGDKPQIKPANRLNTVSEYYFSAKLREIAEMNAAGKKVLNLASEIRIYLHLPKQSKHYVMKLKNRMCMAIRVMLVFRNYGRVLPIGIGNGIRWI